MGQQPQPHPVENNPFLEGFSDWMNSPEGELSREVSESVWELLDTMSVVDARNRKIIWDDGTTLDIPKCIERIHSAFPHFPLQLIETHLLAWLESGFVPHGYSQERLQQLDGLIERWLNHYHRRRRKQ